MVDKIRAGDLYGRFKWRAVVIAHTDQTRIFYRACEMKQWEGSVSKVNEYQLAL